MKSSEQINELATALAAAQGEMENASKSSENPHFRSKYADLAEVINCVRPVFSKHGLSFTQLVGYEQGLVSVETVLMHKSGQWVSGTISAPVSKQDAQGVGSATTYCRRYGLAGMAGLAQEDDDANAAVGGNRKANPNGTPPANGFISREQKANIEALIAEVKADEAKFCDWLRKEYGIDFKTLADLPAQHYAHAIHGLEAKRKTA